MGALSGLQQAEIQQYNKNQIKLIHIAKSKLKLSDDHYRDILSGFGVKSSKELTLQQAAEMIKIFQKLGFKLVTKAKDKNFNELGFRSDNKGKMWATPRQLRMLEAMWMTSPQVKIKSRAALESFCYRIARVQKMEWIPIWAVEKIVKAIQELA